MISNLNRPHDLLVKLLAYAGLRIGEGFALRRKDVDLVNGLIWVDEALAEDAGQLFSDTPKSHQKRPLTLPAYLVRGSRSTSPRVWRMIRKRCCSSVAPGVLSGTTLGAGRTSTRLWSAPA